MKVIIKIFVGLCLFSVIASCGKTGCPDGMHEVTVDGQKICVPNDL